MSNGLWQETVTIAEDYLYLCCPSQRPDSRSLNHLAALMKCMTDHQRLEYHERVLWTMDDSVKLAGRHEENPISIFRLVTARMSEIRRLTWLDVIIVFKWAGMVANHMQGQRSHQDRRVRETEDEQLHRRLAEAIANYLAIEQRDWMVKQKGWDGFLTYYLYSHMVAEENLPQTVKHTIIGVGLISFPFFVAFKIFTSFWQK